MIGLIIAAGKQSRFKSDKPKALCKINDETVVEHNCKLLSKHCKKVYIITSIDMVDQFSSDNYNTVGIKSGMGSGHAIYEALRSLKLGKEEVAICWGDTLLTEKLVDDTAKDAKTYSNYLYVPVEICSKPYVELVRGQGALFKKYGDKVNDSGYHDLSLFYSKADLLLKYCKKFNDNFLKGDHYEHKHGNEFEFFDIINEPASMPFIPAITREKSYSFNTLEELEDIKNRLGDS